MSEVYNYSCQLSKVRYTTKYDHSAGCLEMKMTDDAVCLQVYNWPQALLTVKWQNHCCNLQYKSDAAADVKKMEKFVNNLMRLVPDTNIPEWWTPSPVSGTWQARSTSRGMEFFFAFGQTGKLFSINCPSLPLPFSTFIQLYTIIGSIWVMSQVAEVMFHSETWFVGNYCIVRNLNSSTTW